MLRITGVLLIALLAQVESHLPVRLGYTGKHLSTADVQDIASLLPEDPGNIWLAVGHAPNLLNEPRWYVEVFLAPDRTTPALRRGRVETVVAALSGPQAYSGPKQWQKSATAEYAQVPVRGTDPTRVVDGDDLNRPFRVVGSFTDEDLIAIVDYIRSRPVARDRANQRGPFTDRARGEWPIGFIVRSGDDVEVTLLEPKDREKSGQRAALRRDGRHWTLTRVGYWIAD